ncbi:prepilin peptidase [Pseudonocardia sp. RS010]|uniref:prepilin peptidase n=1 Tax=Pseudonocardia sp. RS010 TaxID=3385979 RepID=UPI0039A153D2
MTSGVTTTVLPLVTRAASAVVPAAFLPPPRVGWAVLGFGLGMLAGAVGRVVLARLRRGARVPPPWLELAVGVPWAGVVGAAGAGVLPWPWTPLLLGAAWLTVVAGVVDVRHHRLPDALTLPALPGALLLAIPLGPAAVGRAAAGAAVLAGAYLLVHTVSPGSLGLGDVKLAAPVGALLTAASWPALLLGCALTAVVSAAAAGFVVVRPGRRGPGQGPPPAGSAARPIPPAEPGPAAGAEPAPVPASTPVRCGRSSGAWRRGAVRGSPAHLPAAELPLGPPMLGSAWLVVVVAALAGAVGGAVGPVGAG